MFLLDDYHVDYMGFSLWLDSRGFEGTRRDMKVIYREFQPKVATVGKFRKHIHNNLWAFSSIDNEVHNKVEKEFENHM